MQQHCIALSEINTKAKDLSQILTLKIGVHDFNKLGN